MSTYSDRDIHFMKLALLEARKGLGRTSPNPCVGAVVAAGERLLSKGYHRRAGEPHAEALALQRAGKAAIGATLYVTLEPCNHQGRTPPCTEKILAAGIKRVVVGMNDPNPLVKGGGNDYLTGRGLALVHGVLADKSRALNHPFIKHITTGLPWVIMKAGLSIDGRIAARTGHSGWITSEKARLQVHRLRDRVDAILVGSGTVLADDPTLTTRLPGRRGRDPLRVVLDSRLRMAAAAKMLGQDSRAATWLFCGHNADAEKRAQLAKAGAVIKTVDCDPAGGLDPLAVLRELGRAGVTSLLVEGGGLIHAAFLKRNLYDQACLFVAPLFLGADGVPLVGELGVNTVDQGKRFHSLRTRRLGDNLMIEGFFRNNTDEAASGCLPE